MFLMNSEDMIIPSKSISRTPSWVQYLWWLWFLFFQCLLSCTVLQWLPFIPENGPRLHRLQMCFRAVGIFGQQNAKVIAICCNIFKIRRWNTTGIFIYVWVCLRHFQTFWEHGRVEALVRSYFFSPGIGERKHAAWPTTWSQMLHVSQTALQGIAGLQKLWEAGSSRPWLTLHVLNLRLLAQSPIFPRPSLIIGKFGNVLWPRVQNYSSHSSWDINSQTEIFKSHLIQKSIYKKHEQNTFFKNPKLKLSV